MILLQKKSYSFTENVTDSTLERSRHIKVPRSILNTSIDTGSHPDKSIW